MEPSARREQILEHAAVLFGQKGYHDTSITDIIDSAGIARGTFYLYFKNKRAIFEELLDSLVVQIQNRIRVVDLSPGMPSPREQILAIITAIIRLLAQNRALLSILLEGAVGLDEGSAKKLSGFYRQIARTIESSLVRGQAMGIVRPCDTRVASLAAVGALKELLHDMLRSASSGADIDRLAAEILAVFSTGVIADGVSIP